MNIPNELHRIAVAASKAEHAYVVLFIGNRSEVHYLTECERGGFLDMVVDAVVSTSIQDHPSTPHKLSA